MPLAMGSWSGGSGWKKFSKGVEKMRRRGIQITQVSAARSGAMTRETVSSIDLSNRNAMGFDTVPESCQAEVSIICHTV